MKRTEPQQLGDIISEALREANLETTMLEHRASFVWAEVMGQGINRYTVRRWVDHGNLHVVLSSGPLKNELSFHRERIIAAINKAVGADVIHTLTLH